MIRIIFLVSVVWVVGFGCSISGDDLPTTSETVEATRSAVPEGESPAANALSSELHDVLVARWEGFKRAAQRRPEDDVLAVELTRTLDGETAVAFTVAQNGSPVRYVVVGDDNGNVNTNEYEHQAAAMTRGLRQTETFIVSADGAIDPSVIALGIPPPQQPSTPGVIAAGAALLTEVFASTDDAAAPSLGIERMERALRAVPASPQAGTGRACQAIDESAMELTALRDVLVARWKGFQQLATKQPNHHILAVELIRALDGETIAAFTVVKNGEPVRYVVAGDTRGRLTVPSAHCVLSGKTEAAFWRASELPDVADPAAIALEEPPIKEPGRPGIIAAGGQLLSAAFGGMEIVGIAAEQ